MKKKAVKYFILLLIVPLVISFILSFTSVGDVKTNPNSNVGGLYIPEYQTNTQDYMIKSSSAYAYTCIFGLLALGGFVYMIVCKKKE